MTKGNNANLAEMIEHRYSAARSLRLPWETLWDECAKYVMPRRVPGLNGSIQSPSTQNETLLFDGTAVRANQTLANGQLAWMSPLESPWFALEPANGGGDDAAAGWYSTATKRVREELAVSNFYTAVHEFYLDRGAFGTACLYVEPGRNAAINAQVWPVGTFTIEEDAEGQVDTAIREFHLTARQAEQRFGRANLAGKILKALDDPKRSGDKFKFLHAVYPRTDAERDGAKKDAKNMPVASVYVYCDEKHVARESGYEEMPVMVSRYLEWGSGMGGLYGWCPAFEALPEARQVNFLQKMMDALAEKAAFPPVLAPDEMEGEIDPNAHGVTYFSRDLQGSLPKEWMTAGRYDIGLDRVKERQMAIDKSFHVDLFQMFAQLDKRMTAREVAERSSEKLIQFSPTFARLTGELFNPLLARVVGILARVGRLGGVPQEVQGQPYNIQYSSRIALALRAVPSIGYQRTLERLSAVAPIMPSVLDNIDFDAAERATALTDGVPAEYLRSKQDVEQIRKARADAAAAAEQAQQAAATADSISKVGRVPSDSPVGEVIKQQFRPAA